MPMKYVTCYEWDKLTGLSEDQLSSLENWKQTYCKKNEEHFGEEDADAIIKFGHIDRQPYVSFTKYVGLIAFKDNLTIEVLPKIFRPNNAAKTVNIEHPITQETSEVEYARALILTMLRACRQIKYKYFQKAHLNSCKLPLLEIFIKMFIDEVNDLVRTGLRCGYETVERNEACFKGKLLISKHIQFNAVHGERCYVQYDEYSVNRLENRLIKSALDFLSHYSINSQNRMALKKLLDLFEDIDASTDFKTDITQYHRDRNLTEYDDIMIWCRLFMEGRSFSIYKGNNIAFALIYPMEKLYEEYIAELLRRIVPPSFTVKTQERSLYLFEDPKSFQLKPDIVVREGNHVWILDTKWKILNNDSNVNCGISQSDMYQMYAYAHRYTTAGQNVRNVTLLYPSNDASNPIQTDDALFPIKTYRESNCDQDAIVHIFKVNLVPQIHTCSNTQAADYLDNIDKHIIMNLQGICKFIDLPASVSPCLTAQSR